MKRLTPRIEGPTDAVYRTEVIRAIAGAGVPEAGAGRGAGTCDGRSQAAGELTVQRLRQQAWEAA